jgi:hypothetical protein
MYDSSGSLDLGPELIKCTRQPGELRISKGACARQYDLACKKIQRKGDGLLGKPRLWSLEVCRTCPKGRLYFETMALGRKTK